MTPDVTLREVRKEDLPLFFEHEQDPDAQHMAAFTADDPSDRQAFARHWDRLLSNPAIVKRTILVEDQVAGHVAKFTRFNQPEVTYWIAREHWGRGIATAALAALLREVTERPIYARAARDNAASLRVLEKCGFRICGHDTGFANARGAEIDEVILELA